MRVVSPLLLALTGGAMMLPHVPLVIGQAACVCPDGQSSYDGSECTLQLDLDNCPPLDECPSALPATGMCLGIEGQECRFGTECCISGPGLECVCHSSTIHVCEADTSSFRILMYTDACMASEAMGGEYCGDTCDGCGGPTDNGGDGSSTTSTPPLVTVTQPSDPCAEEYEATDACNFENGCDLSGAGCYDNRRRRRLQDTTTVDATSFCSDLSSVFCCGLSFCTGCGDELAAEAACEAASYDLTCDVSPWVTPEACDAISQPTELPPSIVCPDGQDPRPDTFCGRGMNREDCEPETEFCFIHPTDVFAVCCPNPPESDAGVTSSTELPPTPEEEPCAEESNALEACGELNDCEFVGCDGGGAGGVRHLQDIDGPAFCAGLLEGFCCESSACPACATQLADEATCVAGSFELDCSIDAEVETNCDSGGITQPTQPAATTQLPVVTQPAATTQPPPNQEPCAEEIEALEACGASNGCEFVGCGGGARQLQDIDGPAFCAGLLEGFCCESTSCPACASQLADEANCVAGGRNLDCTIDAQDETVCDDVGIDVAGDSSSGFKLKSYLSCLWLVGVLVIV